MDTKIIGGILLVIGATIGAGILALPIATAQLGFLGATVFLIACWFIMTLCAFLFLEVNLWLPPNTNLISMAGATLGRSGQIIAWLVYLLLLYSILSAYIAGGSDLFHFILKNAGLPVSFLSSELLFVILFGSIVYFGIRSVDYVNRGLMFGKMTAFFILLMLLMPFVSLPALTRHHAFLLSTNSLTVTVVAFGSLMIIPSLRTYFNDDIKKLKIVILVGTLIPLFCYISWNASIMGILPFNTLINLLQTKHANSHLLLALTSQLNNQTITILAKFFTSICMATSFLSISLSLSDFLADGFAVKKVGTGNIIIYATTFLPPFLIVAFYPQAFLKGLNYAGISCFILMILLPPLMVWCGRYVHQFAHSQFRVPGGKLTLLLLILFGLLMVAATIKDIL